MASRSGVVSRSRSCGMTPEAAATSGALGLLGAGLVGVGWGLFHPRAMLFGPVLWRGPGDRADVLLRRTARRATSGAGHRSPPGGARTGEPYLLARNRT